MHSVESRSDEVRGGAFEWLVPFLLGVVVLGLSWTGLFVVINDFVKAASSFSISANAVHE